MGLNRVELERLHEAARSFGSRNHMRYLAEAVQCIRGSGEPIDALQLLRAMWSSPYAQRTDEKSALDDVGLWLEQELVQNPKVGAERIMLQLGWLRRLSCYYEKVKPRPDDSQAGRSGRDSGLRYGSSRQQECKFGQRLDSLRKRRTETSPAIAATAYRPVVPPPPTVLPTIFAASFVDFLVARKARQTAKERAKRSRPVKEALLPLQPSDPQLRSLAAGLLCSTTATEGFEELFSLVEKRSGAIVPFFVSELEATNGTLLARRILLSPPPAEKLPQDSTAAASAAPPPTSAGRP